MNVLSTMEIVTTTVITLLVLITAPARLDINNSLISMDVKVTLNKLYVSSYNYVLSTYIFEPPVENRTSCRKVFMCVFQNRSFNGMHSKEMDPHC